MSAPEDAPRPPAQAPITAPPMSVVAAGWMPDFRETPDLAAALVGALGELVDPPKEGKATVKSEKATYGYTYLELPDLLAAVRPVLARHQLGVLQVPRVIQGGVSIRSILVHGSGQTFAPPPLDLQCSTRSPQDVGSAITYGRRYALSALMGLAGSEDGDAADVPPAPREQPSPAARRQQNRAQQQPAAAAGQSRPAQQRAQQPPAAQPPAQAEHRTPEPAQHAQDTPPAHQPPTGGGEPSYSPNAPMTAPQRGKLYAQLNEAGVPKDDQRRAISALLAAEAPGTRFDPEHPLTQANAGRVLDAIDRGQLDLWIRGEPLEPPF